jgi:hypothetical protein
MRRQAYEKLKRSPVLATTIVLLLSLVVAPPVAALANGPVTTPGTAQEVSRLVQSSSRIQELTPLVASELTASQVDSARRLYPSVGAPGCMGGVQCTFGDTSAKRSMVLFGDSHALMWLPALGGFAAKNNLKLVVIWKPNSCAVALLPSSYSYQEGDSSTGCDVWHRTSVAMIKRLKPELVVLGERTSRVFSEPGNRRITDAVWRTSLEKAIRQISATSTHVAVMEDLPERMPGFQTCLAAYPTNIQQRCATTFPNTADPGHQQAEREAAAATGASYVMTSKWFCTSTCSPVIGNFIPFYDEGHVSATYAEFLSGVISQQLKPFIA